MAVKKILSLLILLSILVTGCTEYEGQAKQRIYDYYKKNRLVTSDDSVNIIKAKSLGKDYLVLVEFKQSDNGQYMEDLLMISADSKDYYASREAQGTQPSGNDFTLNRLHIGSSTIIFGTFGSIKDSQGNRKKINCSTIYVKLADGSTIEEKVNNERGYIIVIDSLSDIKDVVLMDQEGKVLSSKTNLEKNSPEINKTKFLLTR